MASIDLTPTELAFLGALVKDRIDRFDESIKTLRTMGETIDVPMSEDEFGIILVRSVHVGIARKIEDALERFDLEEGLVPLPGLVQ